MNNLFGKIQEMKNEMEKAKAKLSEITVSAETGAGMVKVTANANRHVVDLEIAPEAMDDKEMLEDLIVAAVNRAAELAAQKGQEELSKVGNGFLPNIPGMDLSQFGL